MATTVFQHNWPNEQIFCRKCDRHQQRSYTFCILCLDSGSVLGYNVRLPCKTCLQSCNNGHLWMFYTEKISPYQRFNKKGECMRLNFSDKRIPFRALISSCIKHCQDRASTQNLFLNRVKWGGVINKPIFVSSFDFYNLSWINMIPTLEFSSAMLVLKCSGDCH